MPTRTGSGSGVGTVVGIVVVVLLAAGVMTAVREQEDSTDTRLPPDPFESNEPRVVDCVARWNNYHGTKANFYCEVRSGPDEDSIEDYYDEDGIQRSPFTWTTTAATGNVVYLDVELQNRWVNMDGDCEIWVDGDTLLGRDEMEEDDEGVWFCRVEVAVP